MTSWSESGDLTAEESADLTERVELFRAAWSPQGSTDLALSLPSPGARHRLAVLVQLVLTDMERRAAAKLPFRVERYINLFPEELASNCVPAELLVAEYRLRHQYTDRPDLAEYERWFPEQYGAIAEALRKEPLAPPGLSETRRTGTIPPVLDATVRSDRGTGSRRFVESTPVMASSDAILSDTPYKLVRKLGAGAFGEVFEALAPGDVPVAVKRIMRSSDHPASQSEKEALEAIKRLSHPYLLKTNAFWIVGDRLMIVMELADTSLADRLTHHQEQGRTGVPPEELIPVFEQAADALDYLHSESVSHRDIKPENILILKGYAKVADFGLARPHEHTLTVVGNTVGTPAYMAPEMWKQKVSLQSDQYSLAATYVRLRLGRPLYSTTVLIDMANCHVNETPDLNPLPAAEQKVLLKALAKNPDHRYPSCRAFAKALREAVFPPPEPPKATTGERRSGALLTTIAVATLCALAVTLGTVFYLRKDEPQEKQSENGSEKSGGQKEPEKPPPLVRAPEWTEDRDKSETIDGKRYPLSLTRKVGTDTLVARLVYSKEKDPAHPPPFYMLENKISKRVFDTLWAELVEDGESELYGSFPDPGQRTTLTYWYDKSKEPKGGKRERPEQVRNLAPDAPMLGVTVPEAILIARRLGGDLPRRRQWLKATGALEKPPKAPIELPAGLDAAARRTFFETHGIGLDRKEPLPVTQGDGDVSSWGIRQLTSNGLEWLGQSEVGDDTKRIYLSPALDEFKDAVVVGRDYSADRVLDLKTIHTSAELYKIVEVKGVYAGFRIVLEPK
jgi:serine/threonine protein kinase